MKEIVTYLYIANFVYKMEKITLIHNRKQQLSLFIIKKSFKKVQWLFYYIVNPLNKCSHFVYISNSQFINFIEFFPFLYNRTKIILH